MNQSQCSLDLDTFNPSPVGASNILSEYAIGSTSFKVRLSELILKNDWASSRVALSWVFRKSKLGTKYLQLKVSKIKAESIIGIPRASETPRSEKFLKNRVPTPSELIQSEEIMAKYGMLKTPSAMDAYSENLSKKEQKFGNSGTLAQEIQSGFVEQRWPGLLLTPGLVEVPEHPDKYKKRQSKRTSEGKNKAPHPGNKYNCLTSQILYSPTEGIESGLWPTPRAQEPGKTSDGYGACLNDVTSGRKKSNLMLPTPIAGNEKSGCDANNGQRINRKISQGWTVDLHDMAVNNMLPTPDCSDRRSDKSKQWGLTNYAKNGMLPTPSASDVIGTPKRADQINQNDSGGWTRTSDTTGTKFGAKLQDVAPLLNPLNDGKKKQPQLSPFFVMEMMGFPVNWTLIPYLKNA